MTCGAFGSQPTLSAKACELRLPSLEIQLRVLLELGRSGVCTHQLVVSPHTLSRILPSLQLQRDRTGPRPGLQATRCPPPRRCMLLLAMLQLDGGTYQSCTAMPRLSRRFP